MMFLKRLTPLVFLILLFFLTLSGCEKCAPPKKAPEEAKPIAAKPEEIKLKETRLSLIPEDYEQWGNFAFSADESRVIYRASKKGKGFVVAGDTPGQPYDSVYTDTIVLSRDGKRIAYSGKKGDKWYFVLDGEEWKQPYENTGNTSFSPDGRFVACEIKDKGKWSVLVLDGEKEVYRSEAYPGTYRPFVFSPDGRLLAFELGDDMTKIENNGRTFFFLDLDAKKIVKARPCTDCRRGRISFSSDSSKAVFDVQKDGKYFLDLLDFASNEEKEVGLPYAITETIAISTDGNTIAYIGAKGEEQFLVVSSWESPAQGKEYGPYEAIVPPVFGPGSTTVAYHVVKGGKWHNVVGDKEGPGYYGIYAPVWSADGSKVAYPAMKNGKWIMVVAPAGNPAKVAEGPAYDMAITPVWSPDGKYIAYRARTGPMEKAKRFIVVADAETGKAIKEGPVSDEVWPPVWSADGKAAAYGARIGRELWWKVQRIN